MKTQYPLPAVSLLLGVMFNSHAQADIILSNVTITDVTPSSFSVLWHADTLSDPRIDIFTDPEGTNNVTSQFEVVTFPLQHVDPQLAFVQTLRERGLMTLQVRGLQPANNYYLRVHSDSAGNSADDSGTWPVANPQLPQASTILVTTQAENSFIQQAKQLMVNFHAQNSEGWSVFVSSPNATYPVSSFVKAQSLPNSAVINLANLFNNGVNYTPQATETLTVNVLDAEGQLRTRELDVDFSTGFSVADVQSFTFDNLAPVDSDGDGVNDDVDAFPNDPTETIDTDGDGVGDNSDVFPNDPTESADSDGDGVGDFRDAYPEDPNASIDPNKPAPGILREWWNGIRGRAVDDLINDIHYPGSAEGSVGLTEFVGPTNWGSSYGAKLSGVFYAPTSGEYTFWVAGDNNVELYLSTNNQENNKRLIASVPGWTQPQQWDKFTQQQSETITLQQGQAYYLEALHKEEGGNDNVAVAWLMPSSDDLEVISAQYFVSTALDDSDGDGVADNVDAFPNDATETIDSDNDGVGDNADAFPNNPLETVDTDGDGVGDNADSYPNDPTQSINENTPDSGILREWWSGVSGFSVAQWLNNSSYPNDPTGSELLTEFAGPTNWGSNYGSRISGVFYAPESGEYTFWISGDNNVELRLSTNNNAKNSRLIAQVLGRTDPLEWDKYPEQQSQVVELQAGQAYYLEALHKEEGGADNVAVAWLLPTANDIEVIPAAHFMSTATTDTDLDGVDDSVDAFPNNPGETVDTDSDGVGDNSDAFIYDPTETTDTDGDGVGDNKDAYPNDPTRSGNPHIPDAGILREWWLGIRGATLDYLRNDSTYPEAATGASSLVEFAGPANWGSNYGSRISGVFYAPETGNYRFWVSGDNNVELYLSSNNRTENKQLIAHVLGWTAPLQWDRFASQESAVIHLAAGQAYYLEALHKEEGGADSVAVAWMLPSSNDISVISSEYFISPAVNDDDLDGVDNTVDDFPNDVNETIDTDGDGVGDNADTSPRDPSVQ